MTETAAAAAGALRVGADLVRAAFARGTDVDACVDLVGRINALAGQAAGSFHDAGIACGAGCSFCCHLRVMVRPHEAIALFRALGALPKARAALVRQRILANAAEVARLGPQGHAAAGLACAFLVEGRCCAYEARPFACAAFHSLDRGRCERRDAGIPMLQGLGAALAVLEQGLDAGLAYRGLDSQRAELHTAVAALVRGPALIARWREGATAWAASRPRGAGK